VTVLTNATQAGSMHSARVEDALRDAWARGADISAEDARRSLLRAAVNKMVRLTQLPHGWDNQEAQPVHLEAVEVAAHLLEEIQPTYGPTPQVGPMPDGAVEITWLVNSHEVHLEVSPDREISLWISSPDHGVWLEKEFTTDLSAPGEIGKTKDFLQELGIQVTIPVAP